MVGAASLSHVWQSLENSIWFYLLLAAVFGVIGAVGNILLSGSFVPSKRVKVPELPENDAEPQSRMGKDVLVFGSVKELGIGAIGAMLTTAALYTGKTDDLKTMIAAALVTGFGGSNFIKRYIAAKTDQMVADHKEKAAKNDEQIQNKESANTSQQAALEAVQKKVETLETEIQKSDLDLTALQPLIEELKHLYGKVNKPGTILLTGKEIEVLHELRGKLRTAGSPSEIKVYQSQIRLLLERGKGRAF